MIPGKKLIFLHYRSLLQAVLFLFFTSVVNVELAAQANIKTSVLAGGGGVSTGTGISLKATIGQSVINNTTLANATLIKQGFWPTTATPISTTKTNDLAIYLESFAAYPNPAVNQVTIEIDLKSRMDTELVVYDLLSKKLITIHQGVFTKGKHQLSQDLSSLQNGTYLLVLRSSRGILSLPLIKMK